MLQTVLGERPALMGGRAVVGSPMWSDQARRARGVDTLALEGFRDAAGQGGQILFARKFDPAGAPAVAAALREGRYERDVLGVSRRRRSAAGGRSTASRRRS
jgi:hypothetical protein